MRSIYIIYIYLCFSSICVHESICFALHWFVRDPSVQGILDSPPSGATKVMARNGMASWANRIRSWQTWKASKAGYAVDALRFDRHVSNLFKLSTVFSSHQCRDNCRGNRDVFSADFCFKFKVDFLPLLLEVTVMPWVSMLEDPNFLSSREPMGLGGTKICAWSDFGIAKSEVSVLIWVTLSLRVWYKVYKHIMI